MSFLTGLGGQLASGLGGLSGLGAAGGGLGSIIGSSGWNPITGLLGGMLNRGENDPQLNYGDLAKPNDLQLNYGDLAKPNAAASGLGKLIGVDPGRISSIADSVGKGMNQIAQGGGAPASYQAPELPAVNNYMQLLDPKVLQALVQYFNGGGGSGGNPNVRQY